jgi:WD40 repeat protein
MYSKLCFNYLAEILTLYKITDNLIASGSKAGDVKIWKRVDAMGNWLVQREMLFHEKNVYAIVAIEGNTTLVTASDDRRIHVVTLNTGQLETSETVDRTFVNSLTKYQKDCFIGGFPDGRIKMWKKVT